MYIGPTDESGLAQLVVEVVDEALSGGCDHIDITLLEGGGCRVVDNGRGMPVKAPSRRLGMSGVEVVCTIVHGGALLDAPRIERTELRCVGIAVVNALSTALTVEVDQLGGRFIQRFVTDDLGVGRPIGPIARVADSERHGTTVTFWPDPTIFDTVQFDADMISARLPDIIALQPGLHLALHDERA